MDRKIVKPALDDGKIWNPEHGRFLPPEGLEVQMTPYWLDLQSRKDIVASDLPAETPASKLEANSPPLADKAPTKAAPAA